VQDLPKQAGGIPQPLMGRETGTLSTLAPPKT